MLEKWCQFSEHEKHLEHIYIKRSKRTSKFPSFALQEQSNLHGHFNDRKLGNRLCRIKGVFHQLSHCCVQTLPRLPQNDKSPDEALFKLKTILLDIDISR
jgi:hypothetical protein